MIGPLISIIIPSYNRAQLIVETLESVMMQTYDNWECIIVDDGSIDKTAEIVQGFCDIDERFKFYKRAGNRKRGASSCRNYGLEESKGELIQFLDSDDLLGKDKLEEQVKLYTGDSSVFTCRWGGFETKTDLESRFKFEYHSYRNFSNGISLLKTFGAKDEFFPPHVYLTPRNLIYKSGNWNEELTNNDDAEFFTRILLSSKGIKFTFNTAVYYRYSNNAKLSSFTSEERVKSAIKSWKLIDKHISREYPNSTSIYVENAKRFLKATLQEKFPDLVKEESQFFQTKSKLSIYRHIQQKIIKLRKMMNI